MGINNTYAKWLIYNKQRFDLQINNVAMLGRQQFDFNAKDDVLIKSLNGKNPTQKDGYAESLFKSIFGKDIRVESFDYSDYEGADYTVDLNKLIPDVHQSKYDLVYDGGTLEHIFNYLLAIKNAMLMTKMGGYWSALRPQIMNVGTAFINFRQNCFIVYLINLMALNC